jgi:tetratricopeptide (TPR) repeat protein
MRSFLLMLALVVTPLVALAQHQHGTTSGSMKLLDGLGDHHHAITTKSPPAQRFFDQGLALAYAFNHPEAKRSFEEAARRDPSCAMCQWGIAFVLGPNINAAMDPAVNAEAYAASRRALALAPNVTAKERAFIEALARRYAEPAPENRAALDSAFARAMAGVAARFPRDDDATVIYAEALMDLTPWTYWTKDKRPLPGTTEILTALESIGARNPKHVGACHFYIHAVEAVFPERAVACAERLAALMPSAGHIVHMPAHIYLRVGRYKDAIRANEHAVHADEIYIADQRAENFYTVAYYPHNYHFLAFTATMAGLGSRALAAARAAAAKIPVDIAATAPDLQLLVAYPHVTLATFGRFDDVLREPLPRTDLRLATGLAWFARGMAFAASRHLDDAGAALDTVRATSAELSSNPGDPVLNIAERVLAAEISLRSGKPADAIVPLTEAKDIEDGLMYMEPPYWHQPVRHLLGAALLDAGRAAEAERLYREDLARFPENVWSLRGLQRSLVAQGKTKEADAVRARLVVAEKEQ